MKDELSWRMGRDSERDYHAKGIFKRVREAKLGARCKSLVKRLLSPFLKMASLGNKFCNYRNHLPVIDTWQVWKWNS